MEQAKEFLSALFSQAPKGTFAEIRALGIRGRCRSWRPVDMIDELAQDALQFDEKGAKPGVYVGINPRKNKGVGKALDVARMVALFADVDCGSGKPYPDKAAAWQALKEFQLPPSIVIDSGNGLQTYWLLDAPIGPEDFDRGKEMMERIAVQLRGPGGDLDKVSDLPRIARIPGTTNRKKAGSPLPVRLLDCQPGYRYRIEDFEKALPPKEAQAPEECCRSKPASADKIVDGQRHQTLMTFAGRLRRCGLLPEELLPALQAINLTRCVDKNGAPSPVRNEEVEGLVEHVGDKPAGDPVAPRDVAKRCADLASEHLAELRKRMKGGYDPFPTGIEALDEVLGGGLPRGQTSVLAGPPGQGKSSLALSIGLHNAGSDRPVVFVPIELGRHDVLARAVSLMREKPWGEVRCGKYYSESRATLEAIGAASLYLSVRQATVEDVVEDVARVKAECEQAPLVIVDYVQLLADTAGDNPRAAADRVASAMDALAKEQGCSVLLLASVPRSAYNPVKGKRPKRGTVLAMAKESGRFESDAALVLGIALAGGKDEDDDPRARPGWIVVAKNRLGGAPGDVPVAYDGLAGRFSFREDEDGGPDGVLDDEEIAARIEKAVAKASPPFTRISQIREAVELAMNRVRKAVNKMITEGTLWKEGGVYFVGDRDSE